MTGPDALASVCRTAAVTGRVGDATVAVVDGLAGGVGGVTSFPGAGVLV